MNIKIALVYVYKMSSTTSTSTETIYSQIQWFSKSKGYGFSLTSSGEQLFCHHSDIRIDGYKYLKRGEVITGTRMLMENGKVKLGNIGPVPGFQLMCQVEKREVREG